MVEWSTSEIDAKPPDWPFQNHNSSFKWPKERSLLTTSVLLCNYFYFMHLKYIKTIQNTSKRYKSLMMDQFDEKLSYVVPKKTFLWRPMGVFCLIWRFTTTLQSLCLQAYFYICVRSTYYRFTVKIHEFHSNRSTRYLIYVLHKIRTGLLKWT